jgi:hypothetical protein
VKPGFATERRSRLVCCFGVDRIEIVCEMIAING